QTKTEHFLASLVGRRVPLYCTAGGRAVLSHLPAQQRQAFFASTPLLKYTPRTLDTAAAIEAEVSKARDKGYASIVDEFIMGEVGLGTAVLDGKGTPYGALHVSGSSNEWSLQ